MFEAPLSVIPTAAPLKPCPDEVTEALAADLPPSPEGLEAMLVAHAGLVHQYAHKNEWALNQGGTLQYDDLVSAGQQGIMRAFETFDPERGVKFVTYATYWVRHFIQTEARNQARTIRVPISRQRKAGHFFTPTDDATPINLSRRTTSTWEGAEGETLGLELVSEDPIPTDDDHSARQADLLTELGASLEGLSPEAREVVTRRFADGQSIRDVAKAMGLSRERVTSISERALARLRRELDK